MTREIQGTIVIHKLAHWGAVGIILLRMTAPSQMMAIGVRNTDLHSRVRK